MQAAALIAVDPHLAVTMEAVYWAARCVHRDLMVVHTEAVALCVPVGEQPALQHAVRREADAGDHVGRSEGGLLHVLEVVIRIAIEFEVADLDQRVVLLRPDLGQIEGVEAVGGRLCLRHDLYVHGPAGEVLAFDGFVEVALGAFPVVGDDGGGLLVGEVPDALLGLEVEFDPVAPVIGTDEAVGVGAEAVHVTVAVRNAAVAHHYGDLVQCFRQTGPEIPVVVGAAHVGARVAFDSVVQVGKLQRVAEEEHRRVVADHVPVALLGVELQSKTADVAFRVRRTPLTGDGGEAGEQGSALAYPGEQRGLGVPGAVMGDDELAEGARALGVHAALGNHLAVEMGELLQEPHVLQPHWPALASGGRVLVITDWCAGYGCQFWLICHHRSPWTSTAALGLCGRPSSVAVSMAVVTLLSNESVMIIRPGLTRTYIDWSQR